MSESRLAARPQAPRSEPRFDSLSRAQCEAVLRRNSVARLAFARTDRRVDIRPIHYVYDGEWIWGRTSDGEKLDALSHNWWVALAVDEVDGAFDWRSVVVNGGFYPLAPGGTEQDVARYQRALGALRRLLPETLAEGDPVPFRNIVFGIAVQELHGRLASTSP